MPVPPELAQDQGPHGTSGEVLVDGVGYAALMIGTPEPRWSKVAIGVGYAGVPAGECVEITALDTGRTIVALVIDKTTNGALIAVSPGAAQALGIGEGAAVRVRSMVTGAPDALALQSGHAAAARLDAPPALLTALRRKLAGGPGGPQPAVPSRAAVRAPTVAPIPKPVAPKAAPRGGLIVQVAALSSAARAAALARELGGQVAPLGRLFRVQLGPFADAASATRARDGAARRGYGDARILHTD